jgi:hypothetical protein
VPELLLCEGSAPFDLAAPGSPYVIPSASKSEGARAHHMTGSRQADVTRVVLAGQIAVGRPWWASKSLHFCRLTVLRVWCGTQRQRASLLSSSHALSRTRKVGAKTANGPLKPARHTRPRARVPSSSQVPDPYPILSNCSQQNTRSSLSLSYMLWLRPVSNIQHMHSACQGSQIQIEIHWFCWAALFPFRFSLFTCAATASGEG